MARREVSKRDAEAVLRAVREQFAYACGPRGDQPTLVAGWTGFGAAIEPRWAILWEGGPYEWAHTFNPAGGEIDEEMTALAREDDPGAPPARTRPAPIPASVVTEPYAGWALVIYPAA